MKFKYLSGILLTLCITFTTTIEASHNTLDTYGDATVSSVLRLDKHIRLHCDISEFPAVIGEDIPVCINALKPASNVQDNLKLLMYLNDLFLSKNNKPKEIILRNIRRGKEFCLIADIYVDGQNLADLLVQQNLARKIIEVPQQTKPANATGSPKTAKSPQSPATVVSGEYVASKSSKVFHRASCPHAKRMDTTKTIYFSTREEAEKNGRRPCKTCKP